MERMILKMRRLTGHRHLCRNVFLFTAFCSLSMYLLYLTVGVDGEAQSDIFHMEKKGGDVKIAIVDQHQEGRIECQ